MATTKTEAQRVTELRKQAMDKSLPQEVRDMADKKANEIEGRSVEKATGVKLAKGGMAKKAAPKKTAGKPMMYGGAVAPMADKTPMPMMAKGGAVKKDAPKKMMYGGAVGKELPMRGQRTATNMAKGGAVKAKKK